MKKEIKKWKIKANENTGQPLKKQCTEKPRHKEKEG